jgi:phage terminase large subunit
MVKVAIDRNRKIIYCDEKIYKDGNSSDQLRHLIGSHVQKNDLIIAEAADARMISELKRYFNIVPINKVKWTIAEALKMMQDYKIVITESSKNLAKELDNYIWNDKKAGIPVDQYNHLIDALRFIFQHFMNVRTPSLQTWHL